jgi:uncharacterized membrane protein YccC
MMKVLDRFLEDHLLGVHYAVIIFTGATLLWLILSLGANTNPVWAISSLITVTDPQVKAAYQTFRSRILNSILGCVIGLIFLVLGHQSEWKLPFALAATVLVSTYFVRVQQSWKIAPITAGFVIATELTHHSTVGAMEAGLKRTAEVMLGSFLGLFVAWVFSKIWPMPEPKEDRTVKP